MRAARYARVSTEEQAAKSGLAAQFDECRRLAAAGSYAIVAEYVDPGSRARPWSARR